VLRGDKQARIRPAFTSLEEELGLAGELVGRVLEIGRIPGDWNGHILGWDELPS
jgi:hypothetical protein